MDLWRKHGLPSLHPELKLKSTFVLEGQYLAISASCIYVAMSTVHEICVCLVAHGHLCVLNTALYPMQKIEWCVYAYFIRVCNMITKHLNRLLTLFVSIIC